MQTVSPVEALLQQWLLLPLFAYVGLMMLILYSARGRVAVSMCFLLYVFGVGDVAILLMGSWGASSAEMLADAFVPPLLAVFCLCYSGGRHVAGKKIWRIALLMAPASVFLGLSYTAGWTSSSPAALVYAIVYYAIIITYLLSAYSEDNLSGNEPALFIAGLTLLFISGPVYDFALPSSGIRLPYFPYAAAAAGALFSWGVIKYKSFSLTPAAQDHLEPGGAVAVLRGVYLSTDEGAAGARRAFSEAVRHSVSGLHIGRNSPSYFWRATGLTRIPGIRLGQSSYEKCLSPSELEVLLHTIRDYSEGSPFTVVLMEDFDYIVSNAGLFRALDFVSELIVVADHSNAGIFLHSGLLTGEERAELKELGVRRLQ